MKKVFILFVLSLSFNLFSQSIPDYYLNEMLITKIQEGSHLKVNVLLYNGADANYIKGNMPAIYYAINSRNKNIVSNLIDYNADVCVSYKNQDILTYTYNYYKTYDPSDQFNIRPEEEEIYKIIKQHYEINCKNTTTGYNTKKQNIKREKKELYENLMYAPYERTNTSSTWVKEHNKINTENSNKREKSWVTRQNEILTNCHSNHN